MLIVLAFLLGAVALAVVAYPIFVSSRAVAASSAATAAEKLEELLAQRDAALTALRDLNFDHRVGKITDEDFVAFEAHLKQVAANALRALDEWELDADRALQPVLADRKPAGAGDRHCPACGHVAAAQDKFCAVCGAALPAAAEIRVCAHCGRPYAEGDRFCAGCGHALG